MKRREFIALGAAAAVYPVTARAQQPRRPLVGVLMSATASDRESHQRVAEFKKLLQNLGWTEGHNVRIELRWFGGELGRAKAQAKALIDLAPDVIVVRSTTGLDAVRVQTRTIPIVFWVVTDPVGGGYVESMARPGGNVTGFSRFEPEMGTNGWRRSHRWPPKPGAWRLSRTPISRVSSPSRAQSKPHRPHSA